MPKYEALSRPELLELREKLSRAYEAAKAKKLALNMSRGVPEAAQLKLSEPMEDVLAGDYKSEDGTDCRNYGALDGIPEAKRLMAGIMDIAPEQVFVGGNSSLNLMHDCLSFAMLHGTPRSEKPWAKLDRVKFLCPSPGYDRHFAVTGHLGVEMLTVPMTAEGPDMDVVENLVRDPAVKGMWCVPKYSNPQGVCYSDAVVKRLAAMKPAAPDFLIMWDNAYAVHDLYPERNIRLLSLMAELEKNGNSHMALFFSSTAKITFAGGGISAIGAARENLDWIKKHMTLQIISYDKVNQLRHARFLPDMGAVRGHMEKHAAILRPKFEMMQEILSGLADCGIAHWENPMGGYFIALDVTVASARRVVAMMKEAGVVMTAAGATHPCGVDPLDRTIRIAPTFPVLEDLRRAAELLCVCVKLASVEALLERPE